MGRVKEFYHDEIVRRSREEFDTLDDEYFYNLQQQAWEQHPDFVKSIKKPNRNDKKKQPKCKWD